MEKYVCKECGSENIQVKAWIDPRTNEIIDWVDGGENECWCEDCQEIREYEIIND